ncbi:MAG: hypothetical protein IPK10_00010 [Bacteroidetes bacterium]|nr:hypothetical protein [Bacteroidota bacterium]
MTRIPVKPDGPPAGIVKLNNGTEFNAVVVLYEATLSAGSSYVPLWSISINTAT